MNICKSFAPIIDADSRILILGSMPGKKSLLMQEYYAHSQNRFWKMLQIILNENDVYTYSDKISLLQRHKIALWDVLKYCERKSSLDSDIKNEIPNDIINLLHSHLQIRAIFCNGSKAFTALKKYFSSNLAVPIFSLHSTSPANARMSLADLAKEWSIISQYLL